MPLDHFAGRKKERRKKDRIKLTRRVRTILYFIYCRFYPPLVFMSDSVSVKRDDGLSFPPHLTVSHRECVLPLILP